MTAARYLNAAAKMERPEPAVLSLVAAAYRAGHRAQAQTLAAHWDGLAEGERAGLLTREWFPQLFCADSSLATRSAMIDHPDRAGLLEATIAALRALPQLQQQQLAGALLQACLHEPAAVYVACDVAAAYPAAIAASGQDVRLLAELNARLRDGRLDWSHEIARGVVGAASAIAADRNRDEAERDAGRAAIVALAGDERLRDVFRTSTDAITSTAITSLGERYFDEIMANLDDYKFTKLVELDGLSCELALLSLPWSNPTRGRDKRQASSWNNTDRDWSPELIRIVARRLSGRPDAQAIFWGLAKDWTGTVGSLVEAALYTADRDTDDTAADAA